MKPPTGRTNNNSAVKITMNCANYHTCISWCLLLYCRPTSTDNAMLDRAYNTVKQRWLIWIDYREVHHSVLYAVVQNNAFLANHEHWQPVIICYANQHNHYRCDFGHDIVLIITLYGCLLLHIHAYTLSYLRSVSTTRVHGPSSRAELTAREFGCIFLTPVNSGRELG